MSHPITVLSLYTGAGGLDYGFEAAGFETRIAIDLDRAACETLRASRPGWTVLQADIHDLETRALLARARLRPGDVDLLIGGPPCQPFSKAAYWRTGDTKRLADPRARTIDAYMRVVREALPRVFLLENVHGFKYTGKEEGFLFLERMAEKINRQTRARYELSWAVLNAADYGVPQIRTRLFVVAHREGERFRFPDPTHSSAGAGEGTLPYVTAWDAIGHLEPDPDEDLAVRGKWADLLPSIPEGQNYLFLTDRGGGPPIFRWRSRYWNFLLKLAKDRPSWTIPASPGPAVGPFHWHNRRLSVRELAALQTFPPDVTFRGGRTAIQRQIGNAVPSLLAEVLAREIASQFFGRSISGPLRLAVSRKGDPPPPEPTRPVPAKYLSLAVR